jgi:signal transduction histidine kinase
MFYIAMITAAATTLLGLIVLEANRTRLINQAFAVMAGGLAAWIAGIYIAIYVAPTLFWGRFAIAASIVWIACLVLFAHIFPDRNRISWTTALYIFVVPAIFLGFSFSDLMVQKVWSEGGSIHGEFGSVRAIYVYFPPVYIFAAILMFFRKYRSMTGNLKLKMKYVLLGLVLTFIPVATTNIILPAFKIYDYNNLGPLCVIILVGLISYAIVRHQFLDIRVAVQLGLIYTVLSVLAIGVYLALVQVTIILVGEVGHLNIVASGAIATLFGIVSAPYIERCLRDVTDRVFFKGKYEYPDAVQDVSEMLHRQVELEEIIRKTREKLKTILKSSSVVLSLHPSHPHLSHPLQVTMNENGTELFVPISLDHTAIASLSLGKKLSGDPYTSEDTRLVQTVSYQIAIALERAQLYKRLGEARERHAKELEEKIAKTKDDMRNMQKAEREMIADLSHGLQTPLAVAKSNLELLAKEHPEAPHIPKAHGHIQRVADLVRDLTMLMRLETMKVKFKEEPVNLSKLVNATIDYFNPIAEREHISLHARVEKNVVMQGDVYHLRVLLLNLLSNARKYMGNSRTREISIELTTTKDGVSLTVSDTGMGIARKYLPHIFQRLYRVKEIEGSHIEGSGLGLSICKKIAEMHDADLHVRSEVAKGTAFTVTFKRMSTPETMTHATT